MDLRVRSARCAAGFVWQNSMKDSFRFTQNEKVSWRHFHDRQFKQLHISKLLGAPRKISPRESAGPGHIPGWPLCVSDASVFCLQTAPRSARIGNFSYHYYKHGLSTYLSREEHLTPHSGFRGAISGCIYGADWGASTAAWLRPSWPAASPCGAVTPLHLHRVLKTAKNIIRTPAPSLQRIYHQSTAASIKDPAYTLT